MALIFQPLSAVPSCCRSLRIRMCHNRTNQNAYVPNTTLPTVDAGTWSLKSDNLSDLSTKLDILSRSQKSKGEELHSQRRQKLKEVSDALRVLEKDPLEGLVAVDALQRLGIDYHYEHEIRTILSKLYAQWGVVKADQERDLFQIALGFRLLRQEGYLVSQDVFSRFLDKDPSFLIERNNDVKGWTSLYEATKLCMEGEGILAEAEGLSRRILEASRTRSDHDEAEIIRKTLAHPHHKSLARFRIKSSITHFESNNKWRSDMKQLAEMDFNFVQLQHQKETQAICEWWYDKGLVNVMKRARNQPLKWYMWSMAILDDPRLSEHRINITKAISLIYTIDDVYDVYGTLDELVLFTEAVNRWDCAAAEQLPGYMKDCFWVLYETTKELSHEIYRMHGLNARDSLQKSWADLCDSFLVEAKWFANKHLPMPEEYLKNGTISSGVYVLLAHLFFLMGEKATNSSFHLLTDNRRGMSYSVAIILRLWDDMGSAEDENEKGADGSYIDCYMNKHKNVPRESAQKLVKQMISDAWKRLNTECLASGSHSTAFRKSVLNVARMVPLMYSYDSNHFLPGLEEQLRSQLYEKIPLPEIL